MEITRAVNITSFLPSMAKAAAIPLSGLEEMLTIAGVDEGSFGIFKVTFADDLFSIYFDYPTDMSEEDAFVLCERIFKGNPKLESQP